MLPEGNTKMDKTVLDPAVAFAELQRTKFRITIEPVGYLFISANIIQMIVTQNFYLLKICQVNFNLSSTLCDPSAHNRTMNPLLTTILQGYTSILNILVSLIDNVPSIFFVLFLGPWSDKHGRKPLMVIPLVGHILSTLIYIMNYYSTSWPAEYLLWANVPSGIFGGMITMIMVLNSYLVDITTEASRTYRLGLLAGIITVALPIAHLVSVPIFKSGGFIAVWCTTLTLYIVAIFYIVFFVKDSRGKKAFNWNTMNKNVVDIVKDDPEMLNNKETGTVPSGFLETKEPEVKTTCLSVMKNLKKCFTVTFRRRSGYSRACISLLLAGLCCTLFSGANHGIAYLYTRKKFNWDAPDFAIYTTVTGAILVFGTLVILPILSGYLKVRDGLIGTISLLGQIGGFLTIAFAVSPLMMFLSSIGMVLAVGIMVVIRSLLSKLVPSDELSHVYSVAACLESIMPLIASPIFNLVYKETLDTFPGCVFLMDAGIELILMILFGAVLYLQWKESKMSLVRAPSQLSIIMLEKSE